jgi:hypothetical protein
MNNIKQEYLELYDDNEDDLELIISMKEVKCDILENGANESMMEFFFCNCDPDQKDPICLECATICHRGHTLSQIYKGNNTCQCGLKNHRITSDLKGENLYVPTCFFHEISIFSNTFVYYEMQMEESKRNICLFCYNFCLQNYPENEQKRTKLMRAPEEDIPSCDCNIKEHKDIKYIFQCVNNLFQNKPTCLGHLTPVHMLNLIFKSDKLLKNVYSSFINYLVKLRESIMTPTFEFDPRMNFSNFYWSLQNFSTLCQKSKGMLYFSHELKSCFSTEFLYDVLDKKFDYKNNIIWQFKHFFLNCFQKIHLGNDMNNFPKFSISDFENLSVLQRLLLTQNIKRNKVFLQKYIENPKNNIIDKFLNVIFTINKSHSTSVYSFNLIFSITGILKKFSKFYLFSNDQKLKYCQIIDEFFYKSLEVNKKYTKNVNNIRSNTNEIRQSELMTDFNNKKSRDLCSLLNIVKTLIYFSLSYNDNTVYENLFDSSYTQEIKFIHSKNDVGKYISKNCINILNYIRGEMETNTDENIKTVLLYSTQLLSLCLNSQDFYLVGLNRDCSRNVEIYCRLIKNQVSQKEQSFLDYLESLSTQLETKYDDFFNFRLTIKMLNSFIKKAIQEFFTYINQQEFRSPNFGNDISNYAHDNSEAAIRLHPGDDTENKLSFFRKKTKIFSNLKDLKELKAGGMLGSYEEFTEKQLRMLIIKSNFIYSLIKIIEINSFYKESRQMSDYDESIVENTLKVLYFFIHDYPDNAIIALSTEILKCLATVSIDSCEKVLDFIYACLHIISIYDYELPYSYKAIKIVKKIFMKTCVSTNILK